MRNMLAQCVGFAWDEGNSRKNWIKHQVTPAECEQIYFNQPLIIKNDIEHSENETRFSVLGQTDDERKLFIAFAVRKDQILVISARDMSRKERTVYEKL